MSTHQPIAITRAEMPSGTNTVLDRRTLERDNKNLLPLLAKGMSVMDVGCGSGAITKGIADAVGKQGKVVGIDTSLELISQAKEKYKSVKNLSFHHSDVMMFETEDRFDLISTSRTLQWMSDPMIAVLKMKTWIKQGGFLSALDYNHEKIEWQPAPPPSMLQFYAAFLNWRQDAGMDNWIADNLALLFSQAGLKSVKTSDQSEYSSREDADFIETAGIWKVVAETRGHQLVKDGYITEEERLATIEEFNQWLHTDAESMKMYLLGVTGTNV
jgi:ubiquinone/menaquinone biosynthesis C-methylase UbiE